MPPLLRGREGVLLKPSLPISAATGISVWSRAWRCFPSLPLAAHLAGDAHSLRSQEGLLGCLTVHSLLSQRARPGARTWVCMNEGLKDICAVNRLRKGESTGIAASNRMRQSGRESPPGAAGWWIADLHHLRNDRRAALLVKLKGVALPFLLQLRQRQPEKPGHT